MYYLGAFLVLGLIFRRAIKESLGPSVAKWNDETLKSWRTMLAFMFVGGMIFGWSWRFIIPSTMLAALSWVGVLALSASSRRSPGASPASRHEVIKRTEARVAQRKPDHSGSAAQLRKVQKSAPLPQIPVQGDYAKKFERGEQLERPEAVVEKLAPQAEEARVRFRGSDGTIDLTELISAAASGNVEEAGVLAEPAATEHSAQQSAAVFLRAGRTAAALAEEPAAKHDERHTPWVRSAENTAAQLSGEEATARAVDRAEKRERELKPAVIAGHTSGPVSLASGVASMFAGSHSTPLSRTASGPIKSLAGQIPHYQLDLRSSKDKAAQAEAKSKETAASAAS